MNTTVEIKMSIHKLFMRQMSPRNKDERLQVIYEANVTTLNTSKNFTLGYLILFLHSVIIIISVILETGVMKKALSFQNILGACKKVV